MTVVNMRGNPVEQQPDLEINTQQAIECMDAVCAILWEECRRNPAKYQHMRIGDGDTARSVLYRIQRNLRFIEDAIGRRR